MRPIHLLAFLLLASVALFVAWFATHRGGSPVHAATSALDSRAGADALLAADAPAKATDEEPSRREAIHVGPSPEERARAEALRKQKETRRVVGRVVDAAGTPIAGARLWASTNSGWIQYPLDVEEDAVPKSWLERQRADTDAEGGFSIEGLEPGPLRLAVRASGFAPRHQDHLELPEYQRHSLGDVVLERGVRVEGRVLGPDGEPFAGARILIAMDCVNRSSLVSIPGRGVPATESGADGTFVVDELATGPWHLFVEAPDCMVAECNGRIEFAGGKETGVVVRLVRGTTISGKITAPDAPVPTGLRIAARRVQEAEQDPESNERPGFDAPPPEPNEKPKADQRTRYALVGEDGSFTLQGLEVGANYRLTASKRLEDGGYRGFSAIQPQNVRAPRAGVELVFKPESAILLRALDAVTGEPITELVVYAGIGRERALRGEKGDVQHRFPDGRVRYGELRLAPNNTKPVPLRVTANGYKDYESRNVGLVTGQELDLGDIRLEPEHVVVATVRDAATGEAIEDARVLLSATTEENDLREMQTEPLEEPLLGNVNVKVARTNAEGRARLSTVPGRAVLVVATARGYRPSHAERVPFVPDSDAEVTVKLDHGGSVLVKITDGAGHPVEGVSVQHRLPRANLDDENVESTRKSDATGLVRFEALENGVHGFRVHEDDGDVYFWDENGSEREPDPWREVAIVDGRTEQLEFAAPPRGTVFGSVREGGRAIEGAHVKFVPREPGTEKQGQVYWSGGTDPFATVSRHDGSYRIEHLRCGDYSALVVLAHRTMATEFRVRVTVEPTQRDFDLDISGVEGRVTDPDGRPLAGLSVRCWRTSGGLDIDSPYQMVVTEDDRGNPDVDWKQITGREIRTDDQGLYRIPGLVTQEPLQVGVSGEWVEEAHSSDFSLSSGEVRHGIDFVVRRAGQVHVDLAAGTNARDDWFECQVVPVGEPEGRRTYTTWMGSWNRTGRVQSVVPGRYKVTIWRGGDHQTPPVHESEVDVAISQVARVSFDPRR